MEKEKIIIRDKRRNPQLEIYSDHPLFEQIKNSMMPDDYREEMDKISNVDDDFREDIIKSYYQAIEDPYHGLTLTDCDEISLSQFPAIMFPLTPMGLWIN